MKRKPFFLSIDIVGRCNLSCTSCPQGNSPVRLARNVMSPETLGHILSKAKREAVIYGVGLFNWGEPFTHPDLPAMIRTVNRAGLLCHLSTNLNSDRNLAQVVAERPHSIRISCSGFTQEIYEHTHVGGDIEKVKANMKRLSFLLDCYGDMYPGKPRTKVHLLWHHYRGNGRDVQNMRNFCAELGFEFRGVGAYHMPLESVLDVWAGKAPLPPLDAEYHTSLMEHKKLCAGRSMPCRNQTDEITIDAAGQVQLCCGVYDPEQFTIGPFLSTPLESIQAHRFGHDFCRGCLAAGGHVYVSGHSHSDPGVVRRAAKAIFRKVAPAVPRALFRFI